jgi:deoxyribose-phosphate aldolase
VLDRRPDTGRLGHVIDHTLLRAEATAGEIDRLCAEAIQHHMFAVCVNPLWVERCSGVLRGSPVKLVSVVDFPLGAGTRRGKVAEAESVVAGGADEVDMVVPLGALKSGDWATVEGDMRAVVEAVAAVPVKVIVESAALSTDELVRVCRSAVDVGAAFVKTSTGFHAAGGATTAAVALMRRTVGDRAGVKASGGIRDAATAFAMIEAGASRIGTSAGVALADCFGTLKFGGSE